MRLIIELKEGENLDSFNEVLDELKNQHDLNLNPILDTNEINVLAKASSINHKKLESIFKPFNILRVNSDNRTTEILNKLSSLNTISLIEDNISLNFEGGRTTLISNYKKKNKSEDIFKLINYNQNVHEHLEKRSSPIVAVIDSGVDYKNRFLKKNLWKNKNIDSYGFNFFNTIDQAFYDVDDNSDAGINIGHGTFVSGIIGSFPENNGVKGVLKQTQILNLKYAPVKDDNFSQVCLALMYAGLLGASVVNCSWSLLEINDNSKAKLLIERILKFLRKQNCIPVFAAMNDNKSAMNIFPQNSCDVITVGSISRDKKRDYKSNWGKVVDIWAPGDSIWSYTANNETPLENSGTSYAAPIVSSAIALMKSFNPDLTIDDIKKIFNESSEKIEINTHSTNSTYVNLLNINTALDYLNNNNFKL